MSKNKPLDGKRIVVTRSPDQAPAMCRKLEALGAAAIPFPAIDFVPLPAPELDAALQALAAFDWLVFTSGNAVRFFWERLETAALTLPASLKIAAVGSATTRLLAKRGVRADFVPDEFTGQQLALGLGDIRGRRILLPRAKIGRPEIIDTLKEQGARLTDIGLYDTVTAVPTPQALAELEKGIDALTFTSPSSVRNFLKIVGKLPRTAAVACIGPSTAAEAEEHGLTVDIVPDNYTIDDLISAVADFYATNARRSRRVKPEPSN